MAGRDRPGGVLTVELERFAYSPMGTFGRLRCPEFQCFTVERPWADNRPSESCIPEGAYGLVLGTYNAGGYPAYEVTGVSGRSLIKIHRGNTMHDVRGCVAPGVALGWVHGAWAVTSSARAFSAFMRAMGGAERARIVVSGYEPHARPAPLVP